MTSNLRKTTGPGWTADHEQRLSALERRLDPKQTDLRRSGGGGLILIEDTTGVSANNNNSTAALFDSIVEEEGAHGAAYNGFGGQWILAPGLYTVAAGVGWAPNATGLREIHVTGTVSVGTLANPPKLKGPAIADAGETSQLSICVPVRSAAGADELHIFGRQTSGAALTMQGLFLSILRHA